MRNRNNNKNSASGIGAAIAVLLIISLINSAGNSPVQALILIVIAIAALGVVLGKKLAKKQKAGERAKGTIPLTMPDSMKLPFYKKEKQSESYVPSVKTGEYNEHTLEESLARDQKRRLEQLDSFLKNGIIDRQEYETLRSRYERS